jgi:hypothetical protein
VNGKSFNRGERRDRRGVDVGCTDSKKRPCGFYKREISGFTASSAVISFREKHGERTTVNG